MRLVAEGGAQPGVTRVASSDGDLLLEPNVLLTGDMIANAKAIPSGAGQAAVSVEFTQEGKARFASITKANVGRKLAILVNGSVISAPVIQQEMSQGVAQISGPSLEMMEADKLAAAIVLAR
jgi:preprotein translocase subunit SecD